KLISSYLVTVTPPQYFHLVLINIQIFRKPIPLFFISIWVNRPHLPSFPTRRSSDLPHLPARPGPRMGRQSAVGRRQSREERDGRDRKSTRLNSSHVSISYAVFCLKTKK